MTDKLTQILGNIWIKDEGKLNHNGVKYNLIGTIGEMQVWGMPVDDDEQNKVSIIVEGGEPKTLTVDELLVFSQNRVMDWIR